eukprot:284245-Lingulodinium_polyedra.AAC.1
MESRRAASRSPSGMSEACDAAHAEPSSTSIAAWRGPESLLLRAPGWEARGEAGVPYPSLSWYWLASESPASCAMRMRVPFSSLRLSASARLALSSSSAALRMATSACCTASLASS